MLSPTIFFFHDVKNDIVKNDIVKNDKLTKDKKTASHHIVSTNFFILNEIRIADKIRDLNSYRFYIFDTFEQLKIAEINSDLPLYSDASILKSTEKKLLLTFEKCELIYLDLYLKALSSSKKYIFELIEFYKYLLQSIDLLVSNNLIHNNINFNTVVINLAFDKPILTNFMYTIDLQASFKKDYWLQYFLLKKTDIFCPVEFYILHYQLTNKLDRLSLYNIETVLKQFIKDHSIINAFPLIATNLLDDGLKFFARYANKDFDENLKEALKYAFTWDNYALSILYLEVLIGLHRTLNINKKVNNKFIIYFMKLLVDNVSLDPSKRPLPSATLTVFENMLQTILMKDYQELIEAI